MHKNNIEVKFEAKLLLKKSPDSTISISELKHAEWTIKKVMEYFHLNNS